MFESVPGRLGDLCLVRESKELELCGVAFTDKVLEGELVWKELEGRGWENGWCGGDTPIHAVAKAVTRLIGES